MTLTDAKKVFRVWSDWFWPSHFILHATFLGSIPESFLPYPQDVLEEALNIVAKDYYENGNLEASKDIQGTMMSLVSYVKDEEAYSNLFKDSSDPKKMEIRLMYVSKYKRDWENWLKEQNN